MPKGEPTPERPGEAVPGYEYPEYPARLARDRWAWANNDFRAIYPGARRVLRERA